MFWNKKIDYENLNKGDVLEYLARNWEITNIVEYSWMPSGKSKEYTLNANGEISFLEVEKENGKLELTFTKQVDIPENVAKEAIDTKGIVYQGQEYEFEESSKGRMTNVHNGSRERLEEFLFYSDNDNLLAITEWDDGSYEAYFGRELHEKSIKKK
jgi:hypothetical protein